MKIWRNLSIRTQLLAVFICSSVIIIGIMGIAVFYSTSKTINQELESTTSSTMKKAGRELEMYLERVKSISDFLGEDPHLIRYLEEGNPLDKSDAQITIETLLKTNPELVSIIFIGNSGDILSNEKQLNMDFIKNMKNQEWYKEAVGSKMPVLTSARMQEFSMNNDTWVVSLGREVKNAKGTTLGILRIDLRYNTIESILESLSLGKMGYSFILNSKKQLVYDKNPEYFKDAQKLKERIQVLESSQEEMKNSFTMKSSYKLQNTDWELVGVASMDGLLRMQNDIVMALWGVGIFLIVIAFGSNWFFIRELTASLGKLEKSMKTVEVGNMDIALNNPGSKEIDSLYLHYRGMIEKINILMEEIRRKEQALRMSELKALYSQINPHFLYNTLDTIVWAAEFGKMGQVISITQAMAKFFRLSLRGGNELTNLDQELEHVRQYLVIQKERYQDKLSYEIHAEEALLDLVIPKIILQPLVENAIYHGIQKHDVKGVIKIWVTQKEEFLNIIVEDNGKGFDRSVPVPQLKEKNYRRLGGIGISNIEERLKIYYGEGFGLKIESEENKGTKIILKLGMNLSMR